MKMSVSGGGLYGWIKASLLGGNSSTSYLGSKGAAPKGAWWWFSNAGIVSPKRQADLALCPFPVLRVWETVRRFYLQRLQLGINSTLQDCG